MSFRLYITDLATGEEREVGSEERWEDWPGADDATEFLWTEGNYSCDCNRGIFFRTARGEERRPSDHSCGQDRYTLKVIDTDNGYVIYDENVAV